MSESADPRAIGLDEPDPVREQERFDPERLRPFLQAVFPGPAGPLSVEQFRKGHSNLTYLVRLGEHEAVLRRAPFGANIKTAHDMGRELRILSGLQGLYPQAPRPIAFCEDEGVIGAKFYLMQRVHGVILRNEAPPAGVTFTPELVRAMSTALLDNLADLHAIDVSKGALAAIGKPQGYVARQVTGWTGRYFNAKTDEIQQLEQAAAWLARSMPPERGAALIHNDYKYDNVVLDPADLTHVLAVLDWEMATVGDPLMDVGTMLGYWIDPDDPDDMRIRSYGPTVLPGSLSRIELVERYAERTGRDIGNGLFYYVFALFKIAVIGQQIYRRWVDGHTKDPRFGSLIEWVRVLGRQATRALDRGRIHGLGAGGKR